MSLLQTVLTDGDGPAAALADLAARRCGRSSATSRDLYDIKHWSERTVIALVMQSLDNSITTFTKRIRPARLAYLTSRQGHGEPNPTWIPVGQRGRTPDGRDHGRHRRAARSASRSTGR